MIYLLLWTSLVIQQSPLTELQPPLALTAATPFETHIPGIEAGDFFPAHSEYQIPEWYDELSLPFHTQYLQLGDKQPPPSYQESISLTEENIFNFLFVLLLLAAAGLKLASAYVKRKCKKQRRAIRRSRHRRSRQAQRAA